MTARRNERPAELQDRDRTHAGRMHAEIQQQPVVPGLLKELDRERMRRHRLATFVRPALTAALAWGLWIGVTMGRAILDWATAALGLCALLLHIRAIRAAKAAAITELRIPK